MTAWTSSRSFALPPWASDLRPAQVDAIDQALDAYARGVEMVVLDAPTGTGKTLVAECIRQGLHTRARYVCTTKSLQHQFMHDFHDARVLKGRTNYTPLRAPRGTTCAECTFTKGKCAWCNPTNLCPYRVARDVTLNAPIAVLNTAYFLAAQGFTQHRSALTVIDEADTLESQVMGHVSVDITGRRANQLGLPAPKITVEESWREWVPRARAIVNTRARQLDTMLDDENPDPLVLRELNGLLDLMWRLDVLADGLVDGTWINTSVQGRDAISFKPVVVDNLGKRFVWDYSRKWLLMSATIVSPVELLDSLGWTKPFEYIRVGSGFDVDKREIRFTPVADMSKDCHDIDGLMRGIAAVYARHTDDRILIHSVSYDLTREISARTEGRPVYSYDTAAQRDVALADFLHTDRGVLVAPSLDRGIDLPDDACRIVIVAKVPYPNLGDKQVAQRLYRTTGGNTWYKVQAIRKLVQMTGRATRHADDWSISYILDSQFRRLYVQHERMFPEWWRAAVNMRDAL